MTLPGRDGLEIDALRTDGYLESLLAQRDGRPVPVSGAVGDRAPDPAVVEAIRRLDRDLMRVHPSFRFEERLARRLAEVAAALRAPVAAGAEGGVIVPLPYDPGMDPADPRHGGPDAGPVGLPRPLLIGAASAALSIAGAAFVAWRMGRPALDPMARAVRAVAESRALGRGRGLGPADRGRIH